MNYLLVKDGYVRYGPRPYSQQIFQIEASDIADGGSVSLPLNPAGPSTDVGSGVTLLGVKAEIPVPDFNRDLYTLSGPFFTLEEDGATISYTVVGLPLEIAKGNLKAKVAAARYEKEIAGTTALIQGVEFPLLTNREDRGLYLQALQLLPDGTTQRWKVTPEVWLYLTKSDLLAIVQAVTLHVQESFDWEGGKVDEIDAVNTDIADLVSINLED